MPTPNASLTRNRALYWPMPRPRRNTVALILARRVLDPATGCLLWPGPLEQGYGRSSLDGRNVTVHRIAWEQARGPIPAERFPDQVVCRVRACSNPEHMALVPAKGHPGNSVAKILARRVRDVDTGCLLWPALTDGGYGVSGLAGKKVLVHRVAWEAERGPIPDGLQIDHRCRVRHCSEISHLELVTIKENVLRGEGVTACLARRTHCARGHLLAGDNLCKWALNRSYRVCRICTNLKAATRRASAQLLDGSNVPNVRKTHCPRGHLLDGANLVAGKFLRLGHRSCRICRNEMRRERRAVINNNLTLGA